MANLGALQAEALAMRRRILEEINAEFAERNAEAAERLRAAAAAANNAAEELRAAENARRAERQRERNAARARRNAAPRKTRKRHPGANYEIAGRPVHLAPGAALRSVEGRRIHSQTLAETRSRRSKAKY
jgi:hypothetical protein